ncbi:peptidoglycan editing factor PgeF [Hyphobacterium sp.]|uniref:peptidoglycan editing factor PgeF n=1 Tax=Hyphobacterium sp. TaxID=2004662 RepID=UPI003747BB48
MVKLITSPNLTDPGLSHGFTTRLGGVSTGDFESLNLSRRDGEADGAVDENRARVTAALGLNALAFTKQVHGNTVIRLDSAPANGVAGERDAMMTNVRGLGLAVQTADCVPLLIFDPENRAIAAVHSGWRGTVQEIARHTLEAMAAAYGTKSNQIRAAIGPSISQQNYRVGPEVLAQFEALFDDTTGLIGPRDGDGGGHLDNAAAVRRQLIEAGVSPDAIWMSGDCTFADDALFSCRRARGGPFGGQAGVIGLV